MASNYNLPQQQQPALMKAGQPTATIHHMDAQRLPPNTGVYSPFAKNVWKSLVVKRGN